MKKLYILLFFTLTSWYSLAQNINKVEYYVDTDPGYGLATNVPVTAAPSISNLAFSVPITSFTDGFHTLFVRSRDANSKWSLVTGRPFVKLSIPSVTPSVSRIEYFIDTDPGYGSGTSIPFTAGTTITNQSFTIPLASVSDGFHTLFVRTKDASNHWSLVTNRPFVKLNIPAALPNITKVEYFIDTDPGYGSATNVNITPGTTIANLNFTVDVSVQTQGAHKLFVRAKDANNKWSLVYTRNFTVCNQAIATANAATAITTSGFTANWSAATGATGYKLAVSADNFTTFVSGYNDKAVTGVTSAVTGLTSGTAYKYRVRAVGATCTSINSATIDVTTLIPAPSAPSATAATVISTSGFTANWNPVTGATGYQLDISADNFATFITGYNAKTITTTNEVITGLSANTSYKYRVRAVNAGGTSGNSSQITALTLANAPVAIAATFVTQNGFAANWNSIAGVNYRLDVSADDFTTFIPGFNDKNMGTVTSTSVTGLSAGIVYKYRVRAVNASGTSVNSNVIEVSTLSPASAPAAPGAIAATVVSSTGFTANWNAVTGATSYQLDISADDFVTFMAGYNSKSITSLTETVSGLTTGTAYKYRVRATNASGTSANSNVIDVITSSVTKQNQSITFEPITDKTLGNAVFTLTATASSSLPVAFTTTSDKITITGSQVTLVKSGRATITASQSGNASFDAAPSVEQSFCINPSKPTITVGNPNTETVVLTSSASIGNQWFKDGAPISGATNSTLSVTTVGIYKVQSKVDDCISEFSTEVPLIVTGDITSTSHSIRIYPNPVENYIELYGLKGELEASRLYDMMGHSSSLKLEKNNDVHRANVQHLAQGAYLIRIQQGNVLHQIKFIKK